MTERKQAPQVAVPRIDVDARLEEANVYASVFGNRTVGQWTDLLAASIEQR